MIGRPQARCTTSALAFMAMFRVPCTRPNRNSARIRVTRPGMWAGGMSSSPSSTPSGTMSRVLPNRSVSRPSTVMPAMAPTANASSARLSSPSLSPSRVFTLGMRLVHAPSTAPKSKNSSEVAVRPRRRAPRLVAWVIMYAASIRR